MNADKTFVSFIGVYRCSSVAIFLHTFSNYSYTEERGREQDEGRGLGHRRGGTKVVDDDLAIAGIAGRIDGDSDAGLEVRTAATAATGATSGAVAASVTAAAAGCSATAAVPAIGASFVAGAAGEAGKSPASAITVNASAAA